MIIEKEMLHIKLKQLSLNNGNNIENVLCIYNNFIYVPSNWTNNNNMYGT